MDRKRQHDRDIEDYVYKRFGYRVYADKLRARVDRLCASTGYPRDKVTILGHIFARACEEEIAYDVQSINGELVAI